MVRHIDGEGAGRNRDKNVYLGLAGYTGVSVPMQLRRKETSMFVTVLIFYAISSLRNVI